MARLDSRKPEDTYGNCLLHKPKGGAWNLIPNSTLKKKTFTEVDKKTQIKILLTNGIIELKIKKGRNYKTISSAKFEGKCILIGISNELAAADVEVASIRVDKKEYR